MAVTKNLPVEVQLALEVMPCQAMRRTFDSVEADHPCGYFAEWGRYHSYDYAHDGPPAAPGIQQPAIYAGKRAPIPEILSGCRKAPIMCVGINPNLPGFRNDEHHSVHPYFEDYLQYAHYFRYRTVAKLAMPRATYEQQLSGRADGPGQTRPLVPAGTNVSLEPASVRMYLQYQRVLDGLATAEGWAGHRLTVGEDLSYANMVGCASAAWVVERRPQNPEYPAMGTERARGIVNECFHGRRYFLRQMIQSLPAVVIVLSKTTTAPFIRAMGANFIGAAPSADSDWDTLLAQNVRVRLLRLPNGSEISARVLFVPHASSSQPEFNARLGRIIGILSEEVAAGRLVYNAATRHLSRPKGACQFCANALYQIGPCDYENELESLLPDGPQPLAAGDAVAEREAQVRAENAFQQSAVQEFVDNASIVPAGSGAVAAGLGVIQPLDVDPLTSKPLVLKGKIVTMTGPVIAKGAVYLRQGKIVAVSEVAAAAPAGFETAPTLETAGVIYPGLIDLHNHLAYNVFPLWQAPRKFRSRAQWRRNDSYISNIRMPAEVLVGNSASARAIARYAEIKLLVGGVTTSQGFGRNRRDYRGLVRNFEYTDDDNLPRVANELFDLRQNNSSVEAFRTLLGERKAVMHHLAEGIDEASARLFTFLKDNELVKGSLVGIHSLGLRQADFQTMAQAGAKVVWSPLSNCLLYGQTLRSDWLTQAGITFGLGCDWSPSGSKNLLQEMKVARLAAVNAGAPLSDEALCKAATLDAAAVTSWNAALGSLTPNKYADLVVLSARHADPYKNLVEATEADVQLVVVAGVARYGDAPLMKEAGLPAEQLELLTVAGKARALHLRHEGTVGNLSLADAIKILKEAMNDFPSWAERTAAGEFGPLSDEPSFTIDLDMDHDHEGDEAGVDPRDLIGPLAEPVMIRSASLDPLSVIDDLDYFERFEKVAPQFLHSLKDFY